MKIVCRPRFAILFALLLCPLLSPAGQSGSAQRTIVRGRLENAPAKPGAAPTPAPGIAVTLENKSGSSLAVNSGKDGFYYIPNIALGAYTLQVWTNLKKPLTFPITVDKAPLQDLPPVLVNLPGAASPPEANSGK